MDKITELTEQINGLNAAAIMEESLQKAIEEAETKRSKLSKPIEEMSLKELVIALDSMKKREFRS